MGYNFFEVVKTACIVEVTRALLSPFAGRTAVKATEREAIVSWLARYTYRDACWPAWLVFCRYSIGIDWRRGITTII